MTVSTESRTGTALRTAVAGPVLFRGDPRVDTELAGFNTAVTHRPCVVVGATSAADVAAAVRFAAARGSAVGVHATGHGGSPSEDTVIISTGRMRRFSVDPVNRTATVEAGVPWGPVIRAAARHGLAPLNGSSSQVGVVGYTLGGGMGPLVRRYGHAADHVRAVEMITADGRRRQVSARDDPDLFWAVRGGKANFGVVTGLTFDLMPVTRLYGGALYYPGADAATLLHTYLEWTGTLGERTTTSIALLRLPDLPGVPPPLRGTPTVHLRVAHLGSAAEGERIVAPMRRAAPALIDHVRDMPYVEVDSIHNDPTRPMSWWERGAFLRGLPAAAADTLLDVAGPDRDPPLVMVELRHLGGAAARQPTPSNAVGGRDAGMSICVVGPCPPALRNVVPGAGHAVLAAMRPWATGGVPVNFVPGLRDAGDVGRAWPSRTYQRLLQVKRRYDPANTFRTGNAVIP